MKYLVAILTSSDENLCKLTYYSIINQENHNLIYDIIIIVNSINIEYYQKVVNLFENIEKPVKIIESISNEYPGKGHNSVLQTFKNSENYTHCILIDSGDFFYPSAFKNLSYYVEYNPDILFISFHDNLTSNIIDQNIPNISINNKCFLNYNIDNITSKLWLEVKSQNPFYNDINLLNTPARPYIFSKKILEYDIFYDENMKLYDDFIVFIKCFELYSLKKINMFILIDSNIYLYNQLSSDSASFNYLANKNIINNLNENNNFKNSIKNKYLLIRDWDLSKIPKLSLGQYNNPGELVIKYNFIINIVNQININNIIINKNDNIDFIINIAKQNNILYLLEDLLTIKIIKNNII